MWSCKKTLVNNESKTICNMITKVKLINNNRRSTVLLTKDKIQYEKEDKPQILTVLQNFGIDIQLNITDEIYTITKITKQKWNDAPPYQREDKADVVWRQKIINTILQDGKFPCDIFLRRVKNKISMFEIADGGHRIRTLAKFVLDEFSLPKKYNVEIDGVRYNGGGLHFSQCPFEIQQHILSFTWTTQRFTSDDHAAALLFNIINNGNEMSAQETRQAINTTLANTIRELARGLSDSNNQHDIFKDELVGFKRGNMDWDEALAKCALYESKTECKSIIKNELDKFYTNTEYWKKLSFEDSFKYNLNDITEILKYRGDNKVLKNDFVNLYLFVSKIKRSDYIIDDYRKFTTQWFIDEVKRKKPEKSLSIGNGKTMNFCTYQYLSAKVGGTKIVERVNLIWNDWDMESYGCIESVVQHV